MEGWTASHYALLGFMILISIFGIGILFLSINSRKKRRKKK